jgi:hypothetical protein
MVEYSSHDWRKNTDDAVVVDTNSATLRVNDCIVRFTNPRSLKTEEVDVSRLIRVFCNNQTLMRKSIK